MASYGYSAQHYHNNVSSHSYNHHGRSRRGPRISSQNAHRQYKAQRSPKELPEPPAHSDYLQRLEAAKSFDLEDDELFCPFHLLTEDDVRSLHHSFSPTSAASVNADTPVQLHSIHSSSSSDRGSHSSGSPESSPLQHQVQPTPSFLLPSAASNAYYPSNNASFQHQQQMKLHQPMAQRTRNAIPIVDPSTRSVASPPISVSPARQMQGQYMGRRW